jgi:predicted amidohydrolase YtcJ
MGVETVILNANVLTMETSREQGRPQAIAIDAGRIRALGSNEQVALLADSSTLVLDLAGKTVLPGFIDCHVHFTQTGLGSLGPQVYGVTSRDAVLQVAADAVGKLAPGQPLLLHGCCFHDLDSPLSLAALDRLAPVNPVIVADLGAHACAFNSQAWRLLRLPPNMPGIETAGDGTLTGLLHGAANTRARYTYYSEVVDDDTRVAALHRASRMALEVGITTAHALDGGSPDGRGWLPQRDVEVLLREQDRLAIRTVVYFQSTRVDLARRWGLPRIGGCVWVDGSYFEHTAGLAEPYTDQPCTCGNLYFAQQELDEFVWEAHRAGLQVSLHAIGDAAIEQLLLAFERALQKEPRADHRHRIEHFSLPTASQIERLARLGVTASMQPNFAAHPRLDESGRRTGQGLEALLGAERFERRHPYRRLLDAGILVAGGSDSDPEPMGPLIGAQQLASHPEAERRLTAYETLQLYTVNAARAAFEESDKGTLSVGKHADLVALADDPLTASAASLASIPVELTMVGGQVAYQRAGGALAPARDDRAN